MKKKKTKTHDERTIMRHAINQVVSKRESIVFVYQVFVSVVGFTGQYKDRNLFKVLGLTKQQTKTLISGNLSGLSSEDIVGYTAKVIAHNFYLARRVTHG